MTKQNQVVTANYQDVPVSFTGDGWFNATVAAEKHGKRVADWLENQDTKEYISALAKYLNVPKERDLIKSKRGRFGGGTWLHPNLAVAFARWLSPDFGAWCDLQIDSILRGSHPHFDWKKMRHEAASSFKVMTDMVKMYRDAKGKTILPYHFSNESRLINWALTGDFKSIARDSLPNDELDLLAKLEVQNTLLIGTGIDYEARKKSLEHFTTIWRAAHTPKLCHAPSIAIQ